jgi:hypothetical protein
MAFRRSASHQTLTAFFGDNQSHSPPMFGVRNVRSANGHQTGALSPACFGICLGAPRDNQRACVGLGQPLRATAVSDPPAAYPDAVWLKFKLIETS